MPPHTCVDRAEPQFTQRPALGGSLPSIARVIKGPEQPIADIYGRKQTMAQEPRLHSLFLAGARAVTRKLASTKQIRRPAQQDAVLIQLPTSDT